jgi:hypothetical protein
MICSFGVTNIYTFFYKFGQIYKNWLKIISEIDYLETKRVGCPQQVYKVLFGSSKKNENEI